MRLEFRWGILRSQGHTNYSAFGYVKSSSTFVLDKFNIKSMACRGGRVYFKDVDAGGNVADALDCMSDMGIYLPSSYRNTLSLFWRGRMNK